MVLNLLYLMMYCYDIIIGYSMYYIVNVVVMAMLYDDTMLYRRMRKRVRYSERPITLKCF
jgi:hypothetical protein